jgi:hypothetical protein
MSYLAAALDIPTLALFDDDRHILWHHLDLARRRFVRPASVYEVANLADTDPAAVADRLTTRLLTI